MPPSKTLVIVLEYNNISDTVKCLDSLSKIEYPNYDVLVIDNDSDENVKIAIAEKVRRIGSNFSVIFSEKNLGYAGGNNIGIRYGLENNYDYFLILNNDAEVGTGMLSSIVGRFADHKDIGIMGASVNEGGRIINCGRVKWLKPELPHGHLINPPTFIGNRGIYIPGVALIVKRETFEKIGLFDERYFLYFEDVDFCLRALKSGIKLAISDDVKIRHRVSSSANILGSPLILRYHYRNSHLFNWKNGPFWVKLALPFWSAYILAKQIAKIISFPKKRKISVQIAAGVCDFYLNRFGKIG